MTFEEAKKILNKEGFAVDRFIDVKAYDIKVPSWEKVEVGEAMKVVVGNDYMPLMRVSKYKEREARLKEEYEKNTKAPCSGEEQPKEKKGIIYPTTFPKADFYYKHVLDEGNPALKESASQFNDALLEEQAKKIKNLVKNITRMDNVIYKKNLEIDKQNKEITRLLSLVEKKENSISRLYYEKSVLEKENEELKKDEIPARYFDKALVDEQSEKIKKLEHEKLDILEMASSCKQTIAELTKKNERLKDQVAVLYACKEYNEKYNLKQIKRLGKEISKLNSIIHDKNAVLADVAEELRLSKIREENLTEMCQKYMKENEELKEKLAGEAKRVEMIRNASKEYCDYGVAANEFIKELASLYVLANNKGIINDEMLERCKNYQTYGFPANCNRETKEEINDIARGKTKVVGADIAEEGGDHSAIIAQCCKNIAISKDEAEIIERCTKNGTELHYSEKDGFTYTNMYGDEMPIICLRCIFHVFTDEEIKNMKK